MNWNDFLYTDTNSVKLKIALIIIVWSRILGYGTVNSAQSQEWTDVFSCSPAEEKILFCFGRKELDRLL